jgi:hypothetical protein
MSGHFISEMRRQMTGGQMRRFVRSLPAFQVDEDLPDPFAELLRKVDAASSDAGGATAKGRG